jgi:hypothetical protein
MKNFGVNSMPRENISSKSLEIAECKVCVVRGGRVSVAAEGNCALESALAT